MPDSESNPERNGVPPPLRSHTGFNRTLVLVIFVMLAGYFIANRVPELFIDRGEAVREFSTMNTYGRIRVLAGTNGDATPAHMAEQAEKAVQRINELMGPYGPASDVRRLNEAAAGEWIEVDPLTWNVVMESLRWHRLSGGAFDPTIGPIKRLFRFTRGEEAVWPDDETLANARSRVGAEKLLFDREGMRLSWAVDGMSLDLGAIAKGFAADQAAQTLIRYGARSALVDIGGELRVIGAKTDASGKPAPWRAGIQDPRGDQHLQTLELTDAAVATSGDYENYFLHQGKRYEHIIDPRSGLPLPEGVASVTVVHPDSCLMADALATTASVLGPSLTLSLLERQATGLFSSGVRVIMLTVTPSGGLQRHEYVVNMDGTVETSSN